jgi:peptide/nickel transport system permease protein
MSSAVSGGREHGPAEMGADAPVPVLQLPDSGAELEDKAQGSVFRMVAATFVERRLAIVGLAIIVLMALFSFLGPHLYHTNQVQTNLADANHAPTNGHPLGTDQTGYDVLGRLMLGGQSSLEVGLAAAILASMVGTTWGAVAGFFGGWVDAILMRIVDSVLAVPPLLFIILVATTVTPTIPVMIGVIALVAWLPTARLVRGESLTLRVRDYVLASRGVGARNARIILRHIVPNVIGTIVVQTTFSVADAILLLAGLSYLGLGPPPPAANWGGMLTDGLDYIYDGYWWLIYPAGIAIVLTVVAFNFIGDALRDALEVRLQRR